MMLNALGDKRDPGERGDDKAGELTMPGTPRGSFMSLLVSAALPLSLTGCGVPGKTQERGQG